GGPGEVEAVAPGAERLRRPDPVPAWRAALDPDLAGPQTLPVRPVEPVVPRPGRGHHRRSLRHVAHLRDPPALLQLDPPRAQHGLAAIRCGVTDERGDQAIRL